MEDELDYDVKFNLYDLAKQPAKKYKTSQTGSTEVARNTSFGDSMYDEQFFPNVELNWDNTGGNIDELISENRAQRQPWIAKAAAIIPRAATKAAAEIAKMPGVVGGILVGAAGQIVDGITGEDNTDFMQVAFNNGWVKAIENANEWVNEEILPVYVKKSVSEGNLWDNITSIDFYATEGADALGFVASMLFPGAVINKLGMGNSLIKAFARGDKYDELLKVAGKAKNFDKAVTRAGKMAEHGLPTNARNIELYAQTIGNTIFEAGAEAREAMNNYQQDLDMKLASGEITQEEYEQLSARTSAIGANIFGANAAILLVPNAITAKILWGGTRNAGRKMVMDGGKYVKSTVPKGLQRVGQSAKEWGKAFGREGFWEEAMQGTVEGFYTDNPYKGLFDLDGLGAAYLETLQSTDGQKAIYLGGLLGGPMQSYQNRKQIKAEVGAQNKMVDFANEHLNKFWNHFDSSVYQKEVDPETGEETYVYETDENGVATPKYNYEVLKEKLNSLKQLDYLSVAYDDALMSGDIDTLEKIQNHALANLMAPFIQNEALGLDSFKQYLESNAGIEQMAKDRGIEPAKLISELMEKATALQEAQSNFIDYGPNLINLKDKNATAEEVSNFYNRLNEEYLSIKSNKYFAQKQHQKADTKLREILEEKGISDLDYFDNIKGTRDNLIKNDSRVAELQDKLDSYSKDLKQIDKLESEFWSNGKSNDKFNKFVERDRQTKKDLETKAQEINDILEQIENAESEEELPSIKSSNSVADPIINQKIKEKKEFFKQKKKEEEEVIRKTQEEQSQSNKDENELTQKEKEDVGNWIDSNLSEEDGAVVLPDHLKYPIDNNGEIITNPTITVESKGDKDVTVKIKETGEIVTIPKTVINKPSSDPINNFQTEGSINHDNLIPTQNDTNENVLDDNKSGNGTQIITTNKETGKLLFENNPDMKNYLDNYERNHSNKKGTPVNFEINPTTFGKNDKAAKAIYDKLERGESISSQEREILIDNLNITARIANTEYKSPIMNKPAKGSVKAYNESSRKLRERIVDALIAGSKIEDITSSIEFQYGGELVTANNTISDKIVRLNGEKNKALKKAKNDAERLKIIKDYDSRIAKLKKDPNYDGKVSENNIFDLSIFKGMNPTEKINYIKKNIAVVNDLGDLKFLDGNIRQLLKPEAKGEIYLMVPKANGEMYPLKLNIGRVSGIHSSIVAQIYNLRVNNKTITPDTLISDINNQALNLLIDQLYDNFEKTVGKKRINTIFGKPRKELLIKDVLNFIAWDGTDSLNTKTRMRIQAVKVEGQEDTINALQFGSNERTSENLDMVEFTEWLEKVKRYNISMFEKPNSTNKAIMESNPAYLYYIIQSGMLNTNGVTGEPLFQGRTSVFINSTDVKFKANPKKVTSTKEVIDDLSKVEETQKADIERRRQEESNSKAQEIVNRGEVKKEFKPITKEDRNNKVDFNSLFSNISKVLSGEIKSEIEEANKILKQYLKEVHPDKFQEENQKLIAEIFTTAMISVGKKGDVNKLNELYNQYKEINAKYDAELAELNNQTESNQISDAMDSNELAKYLAQFEDDSVSSEKVENTAQSVRKTGKEFVSSHVSPSQISATKVVNKKNERKDKVEVTQRDVASLVRDLVKNGVIKAKSPQYNKIMVLNSNIEIYNKLSELAKEYNELKGKIIINCKNI